MTVRFEGIVKSWNDERAFGFIAPVQGGEDIFVHVTAFASRGPALRLNQRVSFELARGPDGRKRACNVAFVRVCATATASPRRSSRRAETQWGGASLFVVAAFLLVYLVLAIAWKVPHGVGIGYLVLSAVCFMAYAADKSAARSGGWRTSENTLLMLGLLGGWPGGVLAQQWLRHKSAKQSFRNAFWLTVVLNLVLFVALSSPRIGAWGLLR